jgi:hypothetical protein
MGKRNKRREARRRAADRAVCALLKAHSKHNWRPQVAERFEHFKPDYRARIDALRMCALRAPEDWRCRIKSRDEDRRFIDLVRFSFARYAVPPHLENAWIADCGDDFADRTEPLGADAAARSRENLRSWHVTAAQGGSLYKLHTAAYLSKGETHHFVTAPAEVARSQQALWYAVARAQTDRKKDALRLAASNLRNYSVASSWWKEVARFLARAMAHHPLPLHDINDLIDYLRVLKAEEPAATLKGRTLAGLRRRQEEWHRALRKSASVCGGSWPGRPIPDVDYSSGRDEKKAVWRFRQIKTGNDLFREGQRMRHCVASYKFLCSNGTVSIWSLTSEFPAGVHNRGVTIEVHKDGTIVQCRGFCNRLPYGNEVTMVKRWAREHGLTWAALER